MMTATARRRLAHGLLALFAAVLMIGAVDRLPERD
jgi:hypothetical protein